MKLKLSIVVCLVLILSAACRSRTATAPEVAPTPEAAVSTPEPVRTDPGFEPVAAEEETLPSDASELTRVAHERGWLRDAFFAYDDDRLDQSATDALSASAQWLRTNSSFKLVIEGHCDERGTESYNLALGERRAATALDYLAAQGVDRDRIRIVSYGEERPFANGSDESSWSQNRRAHLTLTR